MPRVRNAHRSPHLRSIHKLEVWGITQPIRHIAPTPVRRNYSLLRVVDLPSQKVSTDARLIWRH